MRCSGEMGVWVSLVCGRGCCGPVPVPKEDGVVMGDGSKDSGGTEVLYKQRINIKQVLI